MMRREAMQVRHHDILIRDDACPVRLLDTVDRHRCGNPLKRERVHQGGTDLRLVHGELRRSGEIDRVGWGDLLDTGREDDRVADEGPS